MSRIIANKKYILVKIHDLDTILFKRFVQCMHQLNVIDVGCGTGAKTFSILHFPMNKCCTTNITKKGDNHVCFPSVDDAIYKSVYAIDPHPTSYEKHNPLLSIYDPILIPIEEFNPINDAACMFIYLLPEEKGHEIPAIQRLHPRIIFSFNIVLDEKGVKTPISGGFDFIKLLVDARDYKFVTIDNNVYEHVAGLQITKKRGMAKWGVCLAKEECTFNDSKHEYGDLVYYFDLLVHKEYTIDPMRLNAIPVGTYHVEYE